MTQDLTQPTPSKPRKRRPQPRKANPKKRSGPQNGGGPNHATARYCREVPGYREWLSGVRKQQAASKPKGHCSRAGVPNGMTRAEAEVLTAEGNRKAREVLEVLRRAGVLKAAIPAEDHYVETAYLALLEIMFSPMSQRLRLQACKVFLDITVPKPTQKKQVNAMDAALGWLAALAEREEAA